MRSVLVLLLLLAIAIVCGAQSRPAQKPRTGAAAERAEGQRQFQEDQKAIGELQQRDISASIAVDVNELLSLWTDDGVLLPPDHAPVIGRDALRKFYEDYKKALGASDILGYDENWDEVQVVGDWAFQWGTITGRTRPAAGGNEITSELHAMRILKRQPDGSWLIARAIWNNAPAPAVPKPAPLAAPPKPPE
jgi:uncharacterized protein (TIGR02246 family)